jgi:hypothetical protein
MQLFGGPAQAAAAGNFGEIEGETRKWTHAAPVLFFATGSELMVMDVTP